MIGPGSSLLGAEANTKNLISEPGIPELEELYYDKYNYENGSFDSMTDKTKIKYETPLHDHFWS